MTLTKSEQKIYDLLVNQGMRTRDIAHDLGYTSRTLENKISSILQKKQVTSQKELIVKHYHALMRKHKLEQGEFYGIPE